LIVRLMVWLGIDAAGLAAMGSDVVPVTAMFNVPDVEAPVVESPK